MSNLLSLYSDTQKRYYDWLNQTQPKVKKWYDESGLDQKFGQTKDYLWGKERTNVPGHPITQSGTQGLLGVSGQAPSITGLKQSKLADLTAGGA